MGNFGSNTTELDQANVAGKPYLFEHLFPLSASETGKLLRLVLKATNERGSTTSEEYLTALIADVPESEDKGVIRLETGTDFIRVEMELRLANGGSTLLAYELWMDDGQQGPFEPVYKGLERE